MQARTLASASLMQYFKRSIRQGRLFKWCGVCSLAAKCGMKMS